ncbi:MAG TPA: M36 family metallopeptidase [Vicinamibacterales bacterium]|nr:M36 family metallopeptidase [Vicinamibacterales bacterium]
MKSPVRPFLALAVSLLLAGTAFAQPAGYAPQKARTYAGDVDRPLTGPSTASPAAVIAQFLRDRGTDVAEASLVREGDPIPAINGIVVMRFGQTVAGLNLYGTYAKASFTRQGELVHLIENLAVALPSSLPGPGVSVEQALRGALNHLYPGQSIVVGAARREQNSVVFERTAFFHAAPRVTRVAFQATDGEIRPGLLVETWSDRRNQLHHTLVGQGGDVLFVEHRTNVDSYNIFAISPRVGSQMIVAGPAGTTESPEGWLAPGPHSSINIAGNNVRSYLDARSNNTPDTGGVVINDGNFVMAVNLLQSPSTPTNRDVSVQNLFYLNNRLHDILYGHGFTEAAGNFQENNFGRGGLGSDSVNAEAQDGRGENNANFATPSDGSNPRMQMYLFTGVGEHEVLVTAPSGVAGSYKAFLADFGSALRRPVSGEVVAATDAGGVSATDGCEALQPDAVSGLIALVDRGTCTFVVKAANAQAAGAIGLLIANNRGGTDIEGLGGTDRSIRIPVLMISQNDGATLRAATGVQATMQKASTPPLDIDSTLDSDIVNHEYGHGLTWRMIGGMSGPIAGALGEGASDALAMLINGDDRIAEYSVSHSEGLRRFPYDGYPNTYGDVTGTSVHNDGEIYAAIIWRLMTLVGNTPENREQLLMYFVQAMNHIPSTPTFEDMRAGLLMATPTALDCTVWNAFAAFGVGEGSSATISRNSVTVVESFTVPAACQVQ